MQAGTRNYRKLLLHRAAQLRRSHARGDEGLAGHRGSHRWYASRPAAASPDCARLDDRLAAFPITALVDAVEETLATPVQTAVKREDEQEFARLNAANLMFCEDAGRRLKAMLDARADIADFHVHVEHHESRHKPARPRRDERLRQGRQGRLSAHPLINLSLSSRGSSAANFGVRIASERVGDIALHDLVVRPT